MSTSSQAPQVTTDRPFTVQGPTTVAALLGRALEDELTLTLSQAPTYGLRSQTEAGAIRYTLALGQALGRRALMDLLYVLAPYKAHGPDRFARVLDNWGIHDRAAANAGSQGLFMQHVKALGSSWQVFSEHRALFMSVFLDQSEGTRTLPILTWERDTAGVRKWHFDPPDDSLVQALRSAVLPMDTEPAPRLDALVGLVTIPYFLPDLRKGWPAWKPLVKDGKSNYVGPASVPMMALLHRRGLLNSALVRAAEDWLDGGAGEAAVNPR